MGEGPFSEFAKSGLPENQREAILTFQLIEPIFSEPGYYRQFPDAKEHVEFSFFPWGKFFTSKSNQASTDGLRTSIFLGRGRLDPVVSTSGGTGHRSCTVCKLSVFEAVGILLSTHSWPMKAVAIIVENTHIDRIFLLNGENKFQSLVKHTSPIFETYQAWYDFSHRC